MIDEIVTQLQSQRALMERVERELTPLIAECATLLADILSSGGKLLIMGNGGSAADAQHFAAEIVGRFKLERRALPAISLSTDTSIITAVANDYSFETIFSRQVEALADASDAVIGISTSGNSSNVLKALELARRRKCRTLALLGRDGGTIKDVSDLALIVPSDDTPRIQEAHITIIHIICDLVEKAMFA